MWITFVRNQKSCRGIKIKVFLRKYNSRRSHIQGNLIGTNLWILRKSKIKCCTKRHTFSYRTDSIIKFIGNFYIHIFRRLYRELREQSQRQKQSESKRQRSPHEFPLFHACAFLSSSFAAPPVGCGAKRLS